MKGKYSSNFFYFSNKIVGKEKLLTFDQEKHFLSTQMENSYFKTLNRRKLRTT